MNKFKALLAASLALPLVVACGKLESPKKETKRITIPKLTPDQLADRCTAIQGMVIAGHCLTHTTFRLDNGAIGPIVPIAANPTNGQQIIFATRLNDEGVYVTYNAEPILRKSDRLNFDKPEGKPLAFYINRLGFSDVSVSIWTCYNDTNTGKDEVPLYKVGCPPTGLIP